MADVSSEQSIARRQVMFVKTQTAFGTGVIPGESAATNALSILGGGINEVNDSTSRGDTQAGLDVRATIRGGDGPHAATIQEYLNPAGTSVDRDDDALFQNLFEKETAAAVTILAGTSTRIFTTLDAGDLAEFSVIGIPIEAGSTEVEMAVVDSVSTASGVDTVTLKWALSFTPEAATSIPASVQWTTRNTLSSSKYFTMAQAFGGQTRYLASAIVKALTMTLDRGDDAVKLDWEILGQHFSVVSQDTLAAELSAVATTATITNAQAYAGVDSDNPMYVNIESEVIKVTGISGSTITIARAQESTSAALHAVSTAITPWSGDDETTGSPIPTIYGYAWIGGAEFDIADAKVSISEPIMDRKAYGDAEVVSFLKSDGLREISVEMTLLGNSQDWLMTGFSTGRTTLPVAIQMGKTAGYCQGVYMPAVLVSEPAITDGVDGAMTIKLTSRAVIDSDDDESAFFQGSF